MASVLIQVGLEAPVLVAPVPVLVRMPVPGSKMKQLLVPLLLLMMIVRTPRPPPELAQCVCCRRLEHRCEYHYCGATRRADLYDCPSHSASDGARGSESCFCAAYPKQQ